MVSSWNPHTSCNQHTAHAFLLICEELEQAEPLLCWHHSSLRRANSYQNAPVSIAEELLVLSNHKAFSENWTSVSNLLFSISQLRKLRHTVNDLSHATEQVRSSTGNKSWLTITVTLLFNVSLPSAQGTKKACPNQSNFINNSRANCHILLRENHSFMYQRRTREAAY